MLYIYLHTSVLEVTPTEFRSLASSSYKNNPITLLSLFLCGRRSSWRGPQISQRLCTASHVTTTRSRPSPTRPLTEEWWESTLSAVSSPSTSPRPHKVYGMKVSTYIPINPLVKSLNQTKVVYWPNWRLVSLRDNHQTPPDSLTTIARQDNPLNTVFVHLWISIWVIHVSRKMLAKISEH